MRQKVSAVFLLTILLLSNVHSKGEDEQAEKEKMNKQTIGNLVLGGMIGGITGLVAGSTALASSGNQEEAQDGVAYLWSGIVSGVLAAYRFSEKKLEEQNDKLYGQPSAEKMQKARETIPVGMVVGAVTGASFQVASASSDNGSSDSSSSSSNTHQNENGSDKNVNVQQTASLSAISAKMPIIQNAIAGAMASFSVTFIEPEILILSSTLVKILGETIKKGTELYNKVKKMWENTAFGAEIISLWKQIQPELDEIVNDILVDESNENKQRLFDVLKKENPLYQKIESFCNEGVALGTRLSNLPEERKTDEKITHLLEIPKIAHEFCESVKPENLNDIKSYLKKLTNDIDVLNILISKAGGGFLQRIRGAKNRVHKTAKKVAHKAGEMAKKVHEEVGEKAKEIRKSVGEKVSGVVNDISTGISDLHKEVKQNSEAKEERAKEERAKERAKEERD